MSTAYKYLKVSLEIRAEDLEALHFLVSREFHRVSVESPTAFDNPGSWADRIDKLHNQLTFVRDSNFTTVDLSGK